MSFEEAYHTVNLCICVLAMADIAKAIGRYRGFVEGLEDGRRIWEEDE